MKASSGTSAKATAAAPRHTGRSSGKPRPTPTSGESFALAGPSDPPDPLFHAYRKDLADAALAGRVNASHYAEPVERSVDREAELLRAPADNADVLAELQPGERFRLLDDSLGWAWGYAGDEGRVGYVRSDVLTA